MNKIARLLIPAVLLSFPAVSQNAVFPDAEIAEGAVRRGEILPLADILERVSAAYEGRVIEVELEEEDGIRLYEVELITPSGHLIEVDLDAKAGDILSLDDDH